MDKTIYYYVVLSFDVDGETKKEGMTVSSDEGFPLAGVMCFIAQKYGIKPNKVVVNWFTPISKKDHDDFQWLVAKYSHSESKEG